MYPNTHFWHVLPKMKARDSSCPLTCILPQVVHCLSFMFSDPNPSQSSRLCTARGASAPCLVLWNISVQFMFYRKSSQCSSAGMEMRTVCVCGFLGCKNSPGQLIPQCSFNLFYCLLYQSAALLGLDSSSATPALSPAHSSTSVPRAAPEPQSLP